MRKFRLTLYVIIISGILSLCLSGCSNSVLGLGPAADISSPTGEIDNYENGDYVRGSIELSGTSDDDVMIESVKVVMGTEVFDAELTIGETTLWSLPIDTSSYDDGEYTFIVMITDSSGRETEKRLLLYFDNTPPTVLVTSSDGISSGASTKSPLIRGEAYDYLFSRIEHMEAEVISGDAEITAFQGTNGWSLTLQTNGTGDYAVRIKAYDYAGNSNSWLYHSSDFPSDTKIEDIADAESSGQFGTISLASVRSSSQSVKVDLSLDEPVIVVSNPEEGKTASDNVFGGSSKAVGYIEDDDEVDPNSIKISFDGGDSWETLSGDQLSGSGGFIRWSYDLSGLSNGIYNLKIQAADTGKASGDAIVTSYSPVIPFTIDKTAPTVTVDSPETGAYLNSGNISLSGSAEDIGGAIESVKISVNEGSYEAVDNCGSGESVNWSHELTGIAPGAVTIKVEAVDNSGKTSHFNIQVYVDNEEPEIDFLSPVKDSYINGTARLQGVSSDNWALKQVKLQIGGLAWDADVAEVLSSEELYSWQRNIISSNYENTGMAVEVNGSNIAETGTGIWRLMIWAEATDKAGNISLVSHRLFIDNSLDRPGVNIASPTDGSVYAGSVMLSGSAWDDKNESGEALDHIEVRIWKGHDSGDDTEFSELFDLASLLGLDDVYSDGSWFAVDGTSTWQTELNAGGEFYPNETDHNGTVKIDVRAVDQKDGIADLAGDIESIVVTFDDTVPYFDNLSHSSGDYEHGSFTLEGDVLDDDSVERLRISYNGGVDWTVIGSALGASSHFTHSVNTESLISDGSGILYLKLEAVDSANYKTLQNINLNIDNIEPEGSYTANVTDLSGTALVQGTASDSGTVSGIDYIEVTFTLDGAAVNVENSFGTRTPIIIDSRTESGGDSSSNGDHDGFNESMSISGSLWDWWAGFDTTSLDDGVLEILYTIYDYAGNMKAYTVSGGNIRNHAPELDSVSLGWDRNHDGSIASGASGEFTTYTADTTENNSLFGSLAYSFTTDYDGANGSLTYGITVTDLSDSSSKDVAAAASGALTTSDTTVFASGDGNYELEFSVEDGKGYSDSLTVVINIKNTDDVPPTMSFNEIDADDAAAVKSDGTGHIEIDGGNIYLSGLVPFSGTVEDNIRIESVSLVINGGTPVVLGQWNSTGNVFEKVDDDFSIIVDGSGFVEDEGSLLHRVIWEYDWDSSRLPAGLGTEISFIVEDAPNDGDPSGRTASVTKTYDVVPYISSIGTALSSSLSDTMARSALGKYPVLVESSESIYETITIHGWNLDSSEASTTAVRLSSDTDALDSDGTTQIGDLLSHTNTTDDDDEITAVVNAGGSGYLTVIVDGVASRNNLNTNTLSCNEESSSIHQSLSDDRYISLWDVTRLGDQDSRADHAVYPSMAMNGDEPNFAYVNNSEGYGQAYYYDGTDYNQYFENWDLFTFTALDLNDGDENGDNKEHGALVDVNVVNGNYGDYNSGNYGGILVNFFYDVPWYEWRNYTFRDNDIWLENLVDTRLEAEGRTTAVLDRYQYPDLVLEGENDETDAYYSVYDDLTGSLIFRHFKVGTESTIGNRINDEGTALYTDIQQQNYNGDWPNYNNNKYNSTALRFINSSLAGATPTGAQVVSSSASEFSAVAATSLGYALLAYYDTSGGGELVFRYNTTPDDEDEWETAITIDSFVNAQFIDIKVDSGDHIHLAYYDSFNGDVKYAYIPAYNSSEAQVQLFTVDSYMVVGSKLTIDLDSSGTPYLAYKGLGNTAKVAWLKTSAGDGVDGDEFTGVWEVQTVPNQIQDRDSNRFCAGVDESDNPVIGYTDDGLEYVRMLPELAE